MATTYQPIESNEDYERDYIPLPGGWEIQTKGKGSSFRLCDPKGDRLGIPQSPYLYEELTQMARDANAAWKQMSDEIERLKTENESLKRDADRWNLVRTGGLMSDMRPVVSMSLYENGKKVGNRTLIGDEADSVVDHHLYKDIKDWAS